MIKRTLTVYSNLWSAVDREGRPCGACPHAKDAGKFIGVSYTVTGYNANGDRVSENVTESKAAPSYPISDVEWAESSEPVVLEFNQHYLEAIKEGYLLPADQATADAAGIPLVPYAQARADYKARFSPVAPAVGTAAQNISQSSASAKKESN